MTLVLLLLAAVLWWLSRRNKGFPQRSVASKF
jgi:hypothetical protein